MFLVAGLGGYLVVCGRPNKEFFQHIWSGYEIDKSCSFLSIGYGKWSNRQRNGTRNSR
jgi:hypothetical protein